MFKDYEGETEEEAINTAIEDLHIERADFDVEVLESVKKGLLRKPRVKIRVYVGENNDDSSTLSHFNDSEDETFQSSSHSKENEENKKEVSTNPLPEGEIEEKVVDFLVTLAKKVGFDRIQFEISSRDDDKLTIMLLSDDSALLIGRHGQNIDALQVIVNAYYLCLKDSTYKRIVLDTENYRERREESIIKTAYYVAKRVRATKRSALLEPMNSYERRLVHRALDDFNGVRTESEGEGAIKTIRIIPEE